MTHPKLKGRPGILVSEQNTTLGIYINDSSINQLEASQTPENIGLNGYFKVYGIGKIEGMQIGQSEFDAFVEAFKNQFVHNEWNIVKMDISMLSLEKEMNNLRTKTGKPSIPISNSFDKQVEISNYKPNERIVTSVLVSLSSTDENKALVCTMSIVKILDTIIFYSYYQTYKDENTIEEVKNQNDKFGMELLKINN
jgi:CTP synthase (UTP-ammonia lyase)